MLPQSWRLEEDGAREEGCRDEPRVCLHEEPVRASPIHERRLLPAKNPPGHYDDRDTLATDFPEASKALIPSTWAPLLSEPRKKPSTTGSVIFDPPAP